MKYMMHFLLDKIKYTDMNHIIIIMLEKASSG